MPIQVIGAGLGRTGTLSLKTALEELGFAKCYHMTEVFGRAEDPPTWEAAARGEPVDWDRLFTGYKATVDWPGCSFYREILRQYPDAKVILTVRDPERWYDSVRQTIYLVGEAFPAWTGLIFPRMRVFERMLDRIIWDGMFRGRFEDRAFAIEAFNRHNEQVRRDVHPDRLLVLEVSEGWEPLCSFLGVPVPEGKPFPHLNDAAEFRARIERGTRAVRTIGCVALVMAALAAAALGVAVILALASLIKS
jgi:Sulfotransferase domain